MSIHLTDRLRGNLSWLAANWEAKQLQHISSFNEEFHTALAARHALYARAREHNPA
jgi:hypothetical protein